MYRKKKKRNNKDIENIVKNVVYYKCYYDSVEIHIIRKDILLWTLGGFVEIEPNRTNYGFWTDHKEYFRKLWDEGLTTEIIGQRLGKKKELIHLMACKLGFPYRNNMKKKIGRRR